MPWPKYLLLGCATISNSRSTATIDLAIGYLSNLTASIFKQQVLFSHGSACLVRRNHPLYANGISFDQYKAARHIAVEQQSRHRDIVKIALEEHGLLSEGVLMVLLLHKRPGLGGAV